MKLVSSPLSVVFLVISILAGYATFVFGKFYGFESFRVHQQFVMENVYPYIYGVTPMSTEQIQAVASYSNVINFPWGGVFILIPILIAWTYNRNRLAVLLGVSSLITMGLTFVLKDITAIARPDMSHVIEETGYAFPSAHTSLVFATLWSYVLLAILVTKKIVEKYVWIVFVFAYAVFASSIAYTRLFLGVHWLFDILGAISLSLAVASLAGCIYVLYFKSKDDESDGASSQKGSFSQNKAKSVEGTHSREHQSTHAPILGRFK